MSRTARATKIPVWREPGMPALLVLTAAGFAGYAALLPVSPLWAVHGGSNEAGAGLVNGVLLLATILTQPFVPRLLRRFGSGRVLAAGLVLMGAPSLLHLFSDQLDWILVLSVLRGLGFGVFTVTSSTAVAHLVPPSRHGAAIGAYGAAIAVPQVVLLPAGPWLVDAVGYWIVFALGAISILGVIAAPRLARALRAREAQQRLLAGDSPVDGSDSADRPAASGDRPRRRLAARLARPTLLLIGVTLAGGGLITFAPQMSSSPLATAGGLVLLTVTAAVSRWRIGTLADRYGSARFLWPLVLLTVLGLGLTALAVQNHGETQVFLFLTAMALVGIAYGGLQNLTLLLALAVARRHEYSAASAVWNVGFDAGMGIGSVLVGAVATGFSFPVALLVAAAISLATLPLAITRSRKAPSKPAVQI
ncbi:MAG: MFS transporter [Microbacteriaceae bacterium]